MNDPLTPDETIVLERVAIQEEGAGPAFVTPAHWRWLEVAKRSEWNCQPLEWTVQDLIAQGNFIILAAQTQTGKSLLSLFLAHAILHADPLFGKFPVRPVKKVLYMGLEDPDRRFEARLADMEHAFPTIEDDRFIVHVAPDFRLTEETMVAYLEDLITTRGFEVVFLDTYQKATPGLASFNDEQQSIILHRLANLCRKLNVTIIVLDHVRKRENGAGKNHVLALDDIKGTGSKPQNADCIILIERTTDRKQIKFQSFSKDSDTNIRILLEVSPKGSREAKFKYAADLEALGTQAAERAKVNRNKILQSITAEWVAVPTIAKHVGLANSCVQRHLKTLVSDGKVEDNGLTGRYRFYRLLAVSEVAQ
jgi:hypothetical protein